MQISSEELFLYEIRQWCVDALKEFCPKRNLRTSDRKDELIAHVMSSEMKVLVDFYKQRTKKLLQVSNICYPIL